MVPITFEEAVYRAVQADPRYQPGAYSFVRDALHVSVKMFRDGEEDQHVTGQEMLKGVLRHGLDEFGPMALTILDLWGLKRGEDVGNIVYNLIAVGYFGKNDGDSIHDFAGGFDFETAFLEPFAPSSARMGRDQ
ncbi:MAG: hypothetical protein KDK97_05635 [Verrucomicrobiales bacterium]|nr:hypothetical protein [Verrucomicrobiales bacterium]MCP5559148.1 hypothetical protein [Verrucomicrobiaceae bacterium]